MQNDFDWALDQIKDTSSIAGMGPKWPLVHSALTKAFEERRLCDEAGEDLSPWESALLARLADETLPKLEALLHELHRKAIETTGCFPRKSVKDASEWIVAIHKQLRHEFWRADLPFRIGNVPNLPAT
jgi:hypothetical protein